MKKKIWLFLLDLLIRFRPKQTSVVIMIGCNDRDKYVSFAGLKIPIGDGANYIMDNFL